MNNQIDRLANDLEGLGITHPRFLSRKLIERGFIHKSEAVNWVEVCPECNGKKWDDVSNCRCQGLGIVLKKGD